MIIRKTYGGRRFGILIIITLLSILYLVGNAEANSGTVLVSTSPPDLYPSPDLYPEPAYYILGGAAAYQYGTTITVTAQPVRGYTFLYWEISYLESYLDSTSASYTFIVDDNYNLVAVYSPTPSYTISVSSLPSDFTPQPIGGGTYYYGDNITVSAQNVTGYTFQRWTENGYPVSTSATYTFTATGNRNLVAEYSRIPYIVSVSTSPSDLTPQPAGGNTYYYGDIVTIKAQQVTGYTFIRWIENGYSVSNSISYEFKVTDNRNLVAEYSQNQYIILVSASPSSLTNQATGTGNYLYGQNATVTAQPVTGYTFKRWTRNGIQISTNASYSFIVTESRRLLAEYSPMYIISVSTSPSDLHSQPAGGDSYPEGQTIIVTAQPIAGYTFQRWTENRKPVSTDDAYSFMVSGNRNLMAEYSKVATPSITLEPSSDASESEITVVGMGFDIFAEDFPQVSIYFDGTVVKENVKMDKDESGTLGSFRTTIIIPPNAKSGTYNITAQGPKNSASADFVVPSVWEEILEVLSVIGGGLGLIYLCAKYIKPWIQPPSSIGKQFPIIMETRGGIEGTGPHLRDYSINVEVRGGVERL